MMNWLPRSKNELLAFTLACAATLVWLVQYLS
ncbi:hypothetical protein SRABI13_03014 [Erwinia aphidicola]|jgi:hypothetical protein|nr:hypothetical protein [Erwinia aphidicola]CAH0253057.1 hypothetical protein SRABI13_03014 [Erwinia aphidicola]